MKKQGKLIGTAALTLALGSMLIIGNALFATGVAMADVKTDAAEQGIVLSGGTSANGDGATIVAQNSDGSVVISYNGEGSVVLSYNGEGLSGSAYTPNSYVVGQPSDGDIDQDAAISIAVTSIAERYALKQTVLDRFSITATYYATYSNLSGAVWVIEFNPIHASDFSEIGCYTEVLNAETGEVIQLRSAADGIG